jgi:hypothetical protein
MNMMIHFVFIYENGTVKPTEIVLRSGRKENENNGEG